MPGQLGDAYLVLARVYDELGDGERAEWAYTAAIDAIHRQTGWTRELAKAYRWYGKFLKRMGRAEAALEAFELAADLAPSNQDALAPTPQSGVRQLGGASRAYGVASGGAGGSTSTSTGSPAGSGAPRQLSSVIRSLRYWITSRPTATSGSATSTPRYPVDLRRGEQREDHHQRVHADGAAHQLGDDDVALDLVDEQEQHAPPRRPPSATGSAQR